MPDTPVIVDGNSKKFTISFPKKRGSKPFEVDPEGKPLQLSLQTGGGASLTMALGENWSIQIEEVPKPKQK